MKYVLPPHMSLRLAEEGLLAGRGVAVIIITSLITVTASTSADKVVRQRKLCAITRRPASPAPPEHCRCQRVLDGEDGSRRGNVDKQRGLAPLVSLLLQASYFVKERDLMLVSGIS